MFTRLSSLFTEYFYLSRVSLSRQLSHYLIVYSRRKRAVKHNLVKHADHGNNRISQTQLQIHRAIQALPERTEITAELGKLRFQLTDYHEQQWAEDQDFLRQLSTLDYTAMQKESYSKRHATTGQWLLESSDLQAWLRSVAGQSSVLWYQGDPGVGKTVTTSIAVNHVTENIGDRLTAVVYVYCCYANFMTSSVENLLGAVVRQLVEQTSDVKTVAELKVFLRNPARNRSMTVDDYSSWIETLSKSFDVVYTFVDALDECPEDDRDELLRRLQRHSLENMRVFLTSRSNVNVKLQLPHATKLLIAAASEDIANYVGSKLRESGRLTRLIARDPGLEQHIIGTICTQANGMFLLARL